MLTDELVYGLYWFFEIFKVVLSMWHIGLVMLHLVSILRIELLLIMDPHCILVVIIMLINGLPWDLIEFNFYFSGRFDAIVSHSAT
jgi:hypothetical protein